MIRSTTAFQQIANLATLGEEKGSAELIELAALDHLTCAEALERLPIAQTTVRVRYGGVNREHYRDSSLAQRFEWIAARQAQNIALALRSLTAIVGHVSTISQECDVSDLVTMIAAIDKHFDSCPPILVEAKGQLIDRLNSDLEFASAFEWSETLALDYKNQGWTDARREQHDEHLAYFSKTLSTDEVGDTDDEAALGELHETLQELSREYGIDLSNAIVNAEEKLLAFERRAEEDGYRSSGFRQSADGVSNKDIAAAQRMFATLRA